MKKVLPFVFPAIALLIIMFLAYRWYSLRTQRTPEISRFGEGVEIENLSNDEQSSVLRGVGDYKKVTLSAEDEKATATGEVRYETSDDKVKFSVVANLPKPTKGSYQVWLKQVDGEVIKPAFSLQLLKGGYIGSAALDVDALPFEVVITQEETTDSTPEHVLLRGVVPAN